LLLEQQLIDKIEEVNLMSDSETPQVINENVIPDFNGNSVSSDKKKTKTNPKKDEKSK